MEGIDLKITPKLDISQLQISEANKIINNNQLDSSFHFVELFSLFHGITLENFENFTYESGGEPTQQTIVLTAKEGYTFSSYQTVTLVSTIDLKITNQLEVQQSTVISAIKILENKNSTQEEKITALNTVFDGVDASNYENIIIQTSSIPGKERITLIAKIGYSFNDKKQLISSTPLTPEAGIILPITVKSEIPQTQLTYVASIINNEHASNENKFIAIHTLFDGIKLDNYNFFEARSLGEPGRETITLYAKEGYSFTGNKKILSAKSMINLNIKNKSTLVTQDVVNAAAIVLKNTTSSDIEKITALNTVFETVTPANFIHFKIETNLYTEGKYNIKLKANEGFVFGGNNIKVLGSEASVLPEEGLIDLSISVKPDISHQQIKNVAAQLNSANATNETKFIAIYPLFFGITLDKFNNFTAKSEVDTTTNKTIIVLEAKKGFSFGSNLVRLVLRSTQDLGIFEKQGYSVTTMATVISVINDQTSSEDDKILALMKIFDGITPENYQLFVYEGVPSGDGGVIVLRAKSGYSFNDEKQLAAQKVS